MFNVTEEITETLLRHKLRDVTTKSDKATMSSANPQIFQRKKLLIYLEFSQISFHGK